MGRLEELHAKESTANKMKIENPKNALQESQARSQVQTDHVHTLLQVNREWFMAQLKVALDKGWAGWAT